MILFHQILTMSMNLNKHNVNRRYVQGSQIEDKPSEGDGAFHIQQLGDIAEEIKESVFQN